MEKLKSFFSQFGYLLEKNPDFSLKFFLPFLIFFGLMFLTAIVLPILIKRKSPKSSPYRNLSSKIQTPLLFFSLVGLLLIFFAWQLIPYLSAKILIVILQISFIIWLLRFFVYLLRGFSKEVRVWQDETRKLKYLQGAKRWQRKQ